jgi:hypothetical protein
MIGGEYGEGSVDMGEGSVDTGDGSVDTGEGSVDMEREVWIREREVCIWEREVWIRRGKCGGLREIWGGGGILETSFSDLSKRFGCHYTHHEGM